MSLVLVTAVAPYMETFWRPLEVVRNVLVKCQSMRSWRAADHSLRPIHLKWLKHSPGGPLQNSDFQASVSIKTTWWLIPQVSGLHTQSFWFCAEVRPANLHFYPQPLVFQMLPVQEPHSENHCPRETSQSFS